MRAHRRRILVSLLAAPWVLWALVRTFGLDGGHPLVALMAFTTYAALTAIVPVGIALVAREWIVAGVAALALAALAIAIAPRALDGPQHATSAPPADRRLVVMSANLRFGEANAPSLMRLVRTYHVDVLSLLELSRGAVTRLDAAGARELLPGRAIATGFYRRGIGLMARRPLKTIGALNPATGHVEGELTTAAGLALRFVAVHPIPPTSADRVFKWQTSLRALPAASQDGVAHVLLGDFNATLDQRELRRVLDHGYTDAADAMGMGLAPTFPVGRPLPPITIDHVLLPPTIEIHRLTVHDIAGSDHRALIAELVLPPG